MLNNPFAYAPAGNRIFQSSTLPTFHSSSYLHTADNQLTGIYWNAGKLTLRGIVQDCWTTHWVKVKQSSASAWTTAQLTLRKGQNVAWVATNVPVSGTGTLTFDIQAQITNNFVITQTVQYKRGATVADPGNVTYTYDANGNRTNKLQTIGTVRLVTSYEYDTDNQLTRIREWSNSIAQFDYQYDYDPFGRRIKASEDGVTRYFAYDGLDCIIELDSNANVKKWYLRGSGLGGGIGDIIAEVSPTTTNYYCYNHRGDVVGLVSKAGVLTARYEYTAFGLPTTEYRTPNTEYRCLGFSSKEFDARSGLSYYGFRYYDTDSGRWMTKDPAFWQGGINLYCFLRNNSENAIDYMGMFKLDPKTCKCMSDGNKMTEEQERSFIVAALMYWHESQRMLKQDIRKGSKKAQKLRDCLIKEWPVTIVECWTVESRIMGDIIYGRAHWFSDWISVSVLYGADQFGRTAIHEMGHHCIGMTNEPYQKLDDRWDYIATGLEDDLREILTKYTSAAIRSTYPR